MATVTLTQEHFEQTVSAGGIVLVDFWATWCGPCKMIAPVIEQLAQQYEGRVIVGKVDVDQEPELAQEFGVMSIPNVVILKDGQLTDRKVGAMPVKAYQDALDAALN